MTTDHIRPSTLAGIKRLAKTLRRERGISHARALDAAAQAGGFDNIRHAQNVLEPDRTISPRRKQPAVAANPPPAAPQAVAALAPPSSTAPPAAQPLQRPAFIANAHAENLRARIRSNEDTLRAILDGRITGLGYGTSLYLNSARSAAEAVPPIQDGNSLHSAASVATEIERLEQRIAQDRALLRTHEAQESAAGHR